jgi:hypothetical protein
MRRVFLLALLSAPLATFQTAEAQIVESAPGDLVCSEAYFPVFMNCVKANVMSGLPCEVRRYHAEGLYGARCPFTLPPNWFLTCRGFIDSQSFRSCLKFYVDIGNTCVVTEGRLWFPVSAYCDLIILPGLALHIPDAKHRGAIDPPSSSGYRKTGHLSRDDFGRVRRLVVADRAM